MSITFYVIKGETILENNVPTEYGTMNLWELNVSNRNACYLLDILGFQIDLDEMCGSITDLVQLKRNCETTLSVLRANPEFDSGRKDEVSTGANGCTVVDCALPDGYLAERIDAILTLAEIASENNAVLYFS